MNRPVREYEKVLTCLRGQMERGELKPGDRLPSERDLAAALGIGRSSIREALRMLENTGVAESRQGSGNYLTLNMTRNLSCVFDLMLSMHRMTQKEICVFRMHMEETVCSMIMENPCRRDFLEEAERILDSISSASAGKQIDLDRDFHFLLVRATGNAMMIFLMESLLTVYRRWIDKALAQASAADKVCLAQAHRDLMEASLIEGNPEKIRKAVALHYGIIDRMLDSNNPVRSKTEVYIN